MAAITGRCARLGILQLNGISRLHRTVIKATSSPNCERRSYSSVDLPKGPNFGLFFDIDGVIVRGRTLLPHAKEAFKLLLDEKGKFWVPTIFVTNAGNCLRQDKAKQLSNWLGIEVDSSQVVLSHSPLKMFRQFLDKHVLVAGQGPTIEIAEHLGFKHVTTIETLRKCFPLLDTMDHRRRKSAPCAFESYFPPIEAVIMFGEPVRWEMNLQLIIDVLLTNGKPCSAPGILPYPHIPVLACNVDLMWMAEAPMPRFGHGAFLHCVESLYKKISGYDLKYTALVGKPSEITYHHSEHVLQTLARNMGLPGISQMYCIGDNPDVDIYGANLFNRYLQKRVARRAARLHKAAQHGAQVEISPDSQEAATDTEPPRDLAHPIGAEGCSSILVSTGVYRGDAEGPLQNDHMHRDFIMDPDLRKPTIQVQHVLEAVQSVFEAEGFTS